MHVLVPGDWTVNRGHQLVTQIENELQRAIEDSEITTHLESLSDPDSFDDVPFKDTGSNPVLRSK